MIWPLNQLGLVISFSKKFLWWWLFIYYLTIPKKSIFANLARIQHFFSNWLKKDKIVSLPSQLFLSNIFSLLLLYYFFLRHPVFPDGKCNTRPCCFWKIRPSTLLSLINSSLFSMLTLISLLDSAESCIIIRYTIATPIFWGSVPNLTNVFPILFCLAENGC